MNRPKYCIVVLAALSFINLAWAGQNEIVMPKDVPLHLILDLADGSHIIGVPSVKSVLAQTSYAKLDVPLEQIASINMNDDHEAATLELQNGDQLKGVINLSAVSLETIVGKVSVNIKHIKSIQISRDNGVSLPMQFRDGLVLYYSFDRDEREKVTDKSGKGHTGRVYGAEWTRGGASGGAMAFDGNASYIEVPTHSDFSNFNAMSIGAWVYTTSRQVGHPMIIGRKAGSDYLGDFLLGLREGHQPSFHVFNQPNVTGWSFYGNADIALKRWYHIMGTWDGSTMIIYIDGAVDRKRANVTGRISDSGRPIRIGTADNFAFFFAGKLDEIMLFNRVLSEKEVKQIYNMSKPKEAWSRGEAE